jgi:drug/metabolite transporter (DMT)-like permease
MKVRLPKGSFSDQLRSFSSSNVFGPTLIFIASLMWALDGLLRISLYSLPPAMVVTLEHLLGLVILLPFLFKNYKSILNASTGAKISLVVTAILSGALGTIFYTAALGNVAASGVDLKYSSIVLMLQLQPIITTVLAVLLLKEKVSAKFVLYSVFAVLGIYLVSFPNLLPAFGTKQADAQLLGTGLAFLAALSWGAGTVFSKKSLDEIEFSAATAGRFLVTVIFSAILAFALGQVVPIATVSMAQWQSLIIIVLTTGAVALLIYYRGLAHTEAKISAFVELAFPLTAFLIDLAQGKFFTPLQLIGAFLTLWMITRITRLNKDK